jgi:hypothetical protein
MRRLWPGARAALIALVFAVGLVDGCPIPSNKRTAKGWLPTVKKLRKLRTKAMAPTLPIREAFRLHQQWKLFPTASLKQHRLWVEGRSGRDAPWQIMYRPLDDEHTFMADEIEFRRLRGAWNPGRNARRGYAGFVKWVAGEVFAARPDINEVRVRLENIRVKPREGRFESTGRFQYERTRRRERQRQTPVPPVAEPDTPLGPGEEPEP